MAKRLPQAAKRKPQPVKAKKKAAPKKKKPSRFWVWIVGAVIALASYIVLSPSLKNDFTNWDDPQYVYENVYVKNWSPESRKVFFNEVQVHNYHPLTMISLAKDYDRAKKKPNSFFGVDAKPFHATSLWLHVLNVFLVFWFIWLICGRKVEVAALVAILFGIHPMHVESVSWISERKDVLYAFFFMLSLISYWYYLINEKRKWLPYILAFVFFCGSILSKPAAAPLPFILLLLDYWRQRKFSWKLILDKIMFIAPAIAVLLITVNAQSQEAIADWETMTLWNRFQFASYGFFAYIAKMFLPLNLSAFYPYPTTFPITEPLPIIYTIAVIGIPVLFFLLFYFRKKSRVFVFGILFFGAMLLLVLQFVSVGKAMMADRYTYVPFIGLFFIIAWYIGKLEKRWKGAALTLLFIWCAWLGIEANERTRVWENNYTLWTDVIEKYPEVDVAYKNRGNYFAREVQEYEKAMQDYNSFLKINPQDATIFSNRGNLYALMNDFESSLKDYSMAIQLDPDYLDPLVNRGVTYMKMGRLNEALVDLNAADSISPGNPKVISNRAYCHLELGMYDKSIGDYSAVINHNPNEPNFYFFRAVAHYRNKDLAAAEADNSKALQLNPQLGGAYFNRSFIRKDMGNYQGALDDALQARNLGQNVPEEHIKSLQAGI